MLQRFSSWRMLHALVRPNPSYAVKSLVGSRLVGHSVEGLSTMKKIFPTTAAGKVGKSNAGLTKLSVPGTRSKPESNKLGSVSTKKYASGYVYEGSWHEGEWAGNGKLTSAAGQVWEGEFKEGKIFEGAGTIVLPGGDVYEGKWVKGKMEGEGKWTVANGSFLKGHFKNDTFYSGVGVVVNTDGTVSKAPWVEGRVDGEVVKYNNLLEASDGYEEVVNPDGSVLRGEFKGKVIYNGSGVRVISNRNTVEGTWVEGELQGKVKATHTNGDIYIGEVVTVDGNGRREGFGVMTCSTGEVYEGMWIKNKRRGKGKLSSADGTVLEGEWRGNNIYNGSGVLFGSDGIAVDGTWVEGQIQGQAKVTYPSGNIYIGEVVTAKGIIMRDGYGAITYANNGDAFEGMWDKNKRHGKGKHTYADRTVLEGEWKDGWFYTGSGKYFTTGIIFEGTWVEGILTGTRTSPEGYVVEGEFRKLEIYNGKGVIARPDGTLYEGTWVEGKMVVQGKQTSPDGTVLEGEFREGELN